MNPSKHNLPYVVIFLIVIFALNACSEDQPSQQSTQDLDQTVAATPTPANPNAIPGAVTLGGYKVVDAFNVGSQVYVRSMTIDRNKQVLWIGTSVGVLEVDIKSRDMLNTYTRDQGLANEYVFGMYVDQDETKWFGTNGGGISRLTNEGQWKTYFPMHGLADYWVYTFAQQKKSKTLWVGTWAGLNAFDIKTEKFTTYFDELVNEWVYGLGVDSKDNVWVGTEGGINMFDGKTWKTWTHKDGLGAANTDNLPPSSNTGLGTRSRHDLSVVEQGSPTYNPNYVFSLIVDDKDHVWAGTWGGGVAHFDGEKWENFTNKDGLGGNIVYSLAKDFNGGYWFGTSGGLSYYDGTNWVTFTKNEGLLDNSVYAISITEDNGVWAGSRSGVVLITKQ